MELSALVNFKRELEFVDYEFSDSVKERWSEIQKMIEISKREKIAELLGITNEEMDEYALISLYPLTEIFANNILKKHYPYIIYTIKELKENTEKFYVGSSRKLYEAETTPNNREHYIKEFSNSIYSIANDQIDGIARTPITISSHDGIPSVDNVGDYELIAVLSKNSKLLDKEHGLFTTDEYRKLRELLVDENLIRNTRI